MTFSIGRALASAAILLGAAPAWAQRIDDAIIVTRTRATETSAEAEAAARPGGVSVVGAEQFEETRAVSFRDTLAFAPGVIAQPRFGEEVRLSIRGSGLNNNSHLRGVEVLFDGVPINGADGFGDFQELDPLFIDHLSVWRGANAFATGAATLGGAIDIAGLHADAEAPYEARLEGGSFGSLRAHGRASFVGQRGDVLVAATSQREDGFRNQSAQSNGRLYLNGGWRWSDAVETRVSVLGADINQEIPGALTLADALAHPETANPGNIARDYARDINSWRGAASARVDLGADTFSFGVAYTDRHLHHPISIVLDQYVQDGLAFARWDGSRDLGGVGFGYTLGARYRSGRIGQQTYVSLTEPRGARGALLGEAVQKADGYDAFAEARLTFVRDVDVIAGVNAIETNRDYRNPLNPSADDRATFRRTSPRLGVLWRAAPDASFYANYAESFEPPTFSQLTQGGLADFYPIEAQRGRSYEIGARGARGPLRWDISLYEARLDGEFVSFVTDPGNPGATRNAGNAIHRGIEAYAEALLASDLAGGALTARTVWTHGDFRFDGDPTYGGNRLAGAPADVARLELDWRGSRWRLAPNVEWQSGDTYVDYANTVASPGHTLWGLQASWDASSTLNLFLDARNLADESYVSTVSTIADATVPGANLAIFNPGEGRAVFVGARWRPGR